MKITREQFIRYEKLRKSGITNMFDLKAVIFWTDLSKEQIIYIMENYMELKSKLEIEE